MTWTLSLSPTPSILTSVWFCIGGAEVATPLYITVPLSSTRIQFSEAWGLFLYNSTGHPKQWLDPSNAKTSQQLENSTQYWWQAVSKCPDSTGNDTTVRSRLKWKADWAMINYSTSNAAAANAQHSAALQMQNELSFPYQHQLLIS